LEELYNRCGARRPGIAWYMFLKQGLIIWIPKSGFKSLEDRMLPGTTVCGETQHPWVRAFPHPHLAPALGFTCGSVI
jgi:hypothetical protein